MLYQVLVHGLKERDMLVDVATSAEVFELTTVRQLTGLVAQQVLKSESSEFTLMFANQRLEPEKTLKYYQIRNKSTLLMVVKLLGGA